MEPFQGKRGGLSGPDAERRMTSSSARAPVQALQPIGDDSSERHTDTDLLGALQPQISNHTVDPAAPSNSAVAAKTPMSVDRMDISRAGLR